MGAGLGSLLDPILGSNDLSDYRNQIAKNAQLYNGIALPEFGELNPTLYSPESANYQLTADDPVMKSLQLSALNKMSGLADTGLSDADSAEFNKAIGNANQMARAKTDAIAQNAAARGVGGSGLEFLLREQAGQDAAQRAQDAGLDVAANAAKQRALYNQAFLQGAGNVRDQDYRTASNNANIVNQFNRANTQERNQAQQWNAGQRNDAFKYNQDNKQRSFQNQMSRANGIAGVNTQVANTYRDEQAANNARNSALLGAGIGFAGAAYGKSPGKVGGSDDWSAFGSDFAGGDDPFNRNA